jgi:hypothetical protein
MAYTDVLAYACTLLGAPYRWYREGGPIPKDDMFWAQNGPPITRQDIDAKDRSIVCTGLINLMRRYQGLSIPGLDGSLNDIGGDRFPGTTSIWFAYLDRAKKLAPINAAKQYPVGTLLLRDFHDMETDQGHVAVVLEEGLLHAFPTISYKEAGDEIVGCVGITPLTLDAFTHSCLPEHWLLS